jgi:hypothetical protein
VSGKYVSGSFFTAPQQMSISPTFYKRLFQMKVLREAFLYSHIRYELFWHKNIGANAFMLVKLTAGWELLVLILGAFFRKKMFWTTFVFYQINVDNQVVGVSAALLALFALAFRPLDATPRGRGLTPGPTRRRSGYIGMRRWALLILKI